MATSSATATEHRLPDLVADSKLEVQLFPDYSIQVNYISNPILGYRRARVDQTWKTREELGRGSHSVVWLEECTFGPAHGELRAVKKLRKGSRNSRDLSPRPTYLRELEAIAKFSQKRYRDHFLRSFGWYETDSDVFITMEYLPLGDLQGCLQVPLSEREARDITQQLLEGLVFMHDNQFAHRDLKPGNILVLHKGPNWWVKISDFGISKRIDSTSLRTHIGTEAYLAPEVKGIYPVDDRLNDNTDEPPFSLAVDIWSVGAIVFHMITGHLPFSDGRRLFDYVVRKLPFPIMEVGTSECTEFIQETMARSSHRRATCHQALSHSWFNVPVPAISLVPIQSQSTEEGTTRASCFSASAQWSIESREPVTLPAESDVTVPAAVAQDIDSNGRPVEGPVEVCYSENGQVLVQSYPMGVQVWKRDDSGILRQHRSIKRERRSAGPRGAVLALDVMEYGFDV